MAIRRKFSSILLCTLIAGSMDISEAFIFAWCNGYKPAAVLRYITSGLLGNRAFNGSAGYVWLGLGIHYFIAFCWTVLFVVLISRSSALLRRPFVTGVAYGVLIYTVMNFAILPLTGLTAHRHFTWIGVTNAVLALVVCMGLPLAYLSSTFLVSSLPNGDKNG